MGRTIAMPARTVNVSASIAAEPSFPWSASCTDRPGRNGPMPVAPPLLHYAVGMAAFGKSAPLRRSWTDTPCGKMHARVGGGPSAGSPVVLVHGLVISGRYMAPTAAALSLLCPVYAIDLPGYGDSDQPRAILGPSRLTDSLAAR